MNRREWTFAALLALVFAPGLVALARVWSSVEYYSHGYLVPLVALFLAHGLARQHARLPRRPDRRGALALVAALLLYAASFTAGAPAGQGLALVGALASAVWLLRGADWLRALAFPLAYLLFAVPLPPDWLAPVIVGLLVFVSAGSVAVLNGLGVAATRQGSVLVLPNGESLFVTDACSGLTSLVTLVPIAVLIAYLAPLPRFARVLVVASVVPVAMAANLLRVVVTALGAQWWGAQAVTGDPVHTLLGLGVLALGCLGLLALARALARERPARRAAPQAP